MLIYYFALLFLLYVLKYVHGVPWNTELILSGLSWFIKVNQIELFYFILGLLKLAPKDLVTKRSLFSKRLLISQRVTHSFYLEISYKTPHKLLIIHHKLSMTQKHLHYPHFKVSIKKLHH